MDPRVKMIILVILTIVIFAISNFYVLATMFVLVLLVWKTGKLPMKNILKYMKFLLSLVAFLIVLQGLFFSSGENPVILLQPIIPDVVPLIGGIGTVYLDGILFGLVLGLRLLTLVCIMPIFTMTTTISETALGLVKLGMNYKYAYMTTTALNLIPTLQEETMTIMDAQKMRGFTVFETGKTMDKLKAYTTLVVPLVVGSMRRAQLMGVAMEGRAFGALKTRTYREDLTMQTRDIVYVVLVVLICIGMIYFNIRLGGWY
jgi:energy-coupling factor transport system permease protein